MTTPLTSQLRIGANPITSVGATVVNAARSQIGVTYAWGGGTKDGPSQGIHDGGVADSFGDYKKIGFDCSGLALFAWGKAGVTLPRTSREQKVACANIPDSARQAGDLVFWGTPVHHVAIWTGEGNTIVEALESGTTVHEVAFNPRSDYVGAGRPTGGSVASVLDTLGTTGGGAGSVGGLLGLPALAEPMILFAIAAIIGVVVVFSQAGKST
jgi:cell wall-associated NlpC family hydrolase